MIKLYIVDLEEGTINRLEQLFYNNPQLGISLVGYAHNYNTCYNDVERTKHADVFLISAYLPDQMGFDLTAVIKKRNPKAKVIVMLENNTRNLAEISREKGASEILQKPFKAKALIDMIQSLVSPADIASGDEGFGSPYSPPDSGAGPSAYQAYGDNALVSPFSDESENAHSNNRKMVVAFYSTSSAGRTTLLVNVAAAIRKYSEYNPSVCILDFNLLTPSVIHKFDDDDLVEGGDRNLYSVCEDIVSISENLIREALIEHEPTEIRIMDTPEASSGHVSHVSVANLKPLIEYLKSMFDVILIDTGTDWRSDATIFPLTITDKNIVVVQPDVSSIVHTKNFVNALRSFEGNVAGGMTSKMTFVLNKDSQKAGMTSELVQMHLESPIRFQIPDDPAIAKLSNYGQFVIDSNSVSAKSIIDLAKFIYPFEKEMDLGYGSKKKPAKPVKPNGGKSSGSLFGSLFKKAKK